MFVSTCVDDNHACQQSKTCLLTKQDTCPSNQSYTEVNKQPETYR